MKGITVKIDDNGHKWQRLTGIRSGKLELMPVRLSDVPDGHLYESYRTHRGDISHALHRVKGEKLTTLIKPTHLRDNPDVSVAEFAAECIQKGVPDNSAQMVLMPEKPKAEAKGCTCFVTTDRLLLPLVPTADGYAISFRGRTGLLKRDGKTWTGSYREQVNSGSKTEMEKWVRGQLLAESYKSLQFDGDSVRIEWKSEAVDVYEARAGTVRMKVERQMDAWVWQCWLRAGNMSGTAQTKRGAMKAAALCLGAP